MSVPLQTVPDHQDGKDASFEDGPASHARREAAEIIARARREAEAIVAEARSSDSVGASPLAALGENAEEIIGQVRKLIKKQRELQTERQGMLSQIKALESERDELVHRLTDAVERMEELAAIADGAQALSAERNTPPPLPKADPQPEASPIPPRAQEPPAPRRRAAESAPPQEDTSLAARLKKAEQAEQAEQGDSSLAARLENAEQAEKESSALAARIEQNEQNIAAAVTAERAGAATYTDDNIGVNDDARSFYDRHSAKLPRLEGDGGRSVLSAMSGMRPEPDTKTRKGRRSRRK